MTVSPPASRSGEDLGELTLAGRLAQRIGRQIESQALRPGTRLASIRDLARSAGVSRFTVVQAYDRLVAAGLVGSRRGSGFFVLPRPRPALSPERPRTPAVPSRIDVSWLLRSMFVADASTAMPGSAGLLPPEWLDAEMVASAVRAVGRSARSSLVGYGHPQGFAPLRQQIAARLQAEGITVHPERQIVTTAGVTQAIDLVVRHCVAPGDTVLVEDPGWFVVFGRLAAFGVRVVGVPRTAAGPDIEALERLAQLHRPRLFIVNSVVHNPTGHTLTAGAAYAVLRAAERYDFLVIEDDTYSELHPGGAIRLAALDGLARVIHVGGFSKMLAASLRVGYIAAAPELALGLADVKMLTGLTSPELGERVVHRVLADGQYRRHVERVRQRVDEARERCLQRLASLGVRMETAPQAGMFVWADCGCDSEALAREAAAQGMLLAPGILFNPEQKPSSMMRFSVVSADDESAWRTLARLLPGAPPSVKFA
ncbi:PLP-dependent aminotransferase family protein [Verticiella sediminum]|uniref:PLP-dependent aminotransferase family protein n=1 Tax=Verticiella sediminum TaxID=1247510 RepID=A0A556AVV9_9BURK|nr:PLP-dependent aminotransferase family protein [Verticiella sediminum]TSH97054.1 PLP-dependent aminotransferase family protein [Verticiella sediminum]